MQHFEKNLLGILEKSLDGFEALESTKRLTSGASRITFEISTICKGKPKKLESSSHGSRYFCKECGTPIVCLLEEYPKSIYITICSLDRPEEYEPKGDIYKEDKLPWEFNF